MPQGIDLSLIHILGLSFMAVGEHPRAAESAGIQVKKYRWIVMVFNGILGGIGGAYLVLVQLGVFTENMISGRGYICLLYTSLYIYYTRCFLIRNRHLFCNRSSSRFSERSEAR